MDAALLTVFSVITREDILSNLVQNMRTRDPLVFTRWVHYCTTYLPRWQRQLTYEENKQEQVVVKNMLPNSIAYKHDMTLDESKNLLSWFSQKRVLVVATQAPGFGGSATNAYKIARFFREVIGSQTGLVFFEHMDFTSSDSYDPMKIGGVWRLPRFNKFQNTKIKHIRNQCRRDIRRSKVTIEKYLGGPPDIILCKNYLSPHVVRMIFPSVPLVYLVSGSWHATHMKKTAIEILEISPDKLNNMLLLEKQTNNMVDLIIPNSWISRIVFTHIYGDAKSCYPIDTSNMYNTIPKSEKLPCANWEDRKFDVAFVVSSLSRTIKGPHIASEVFEHPFLSNLSKVVVGDSNVQSPSFDHVSNCTRSNRMTHQECMNLLLQCKIVIMPSLFDASPNLLTEAISSGCYPIVTPNIGNIDNINNMLVVSTLLDIEEWAATIQNVVNTPPSYIIQKENEEHKQSFASQIIHVLKPLLI